MTPQTAIEGLPKYKNGSTAIPKDEVVVPYSAVVSAIEEIEKRIETLMKEELLKEFLKKMDEFVLVKSTCSVSGKVENLPCIVEDQEATIRLNGEWDREDLKDILEDLTNQK